MTLVFYKTNNNFLQNVDCLMNVPTKYQSSLHIKDHAEVSLRIAVAGE